MTADFPWLNHIIGPLVSLSTDTSGKPYKIFYTNMNIASTYLLALGVILLIGFIGVAIFCLAYRSVEGKKSERNKKLIVFISFLDSFFVFGIVFAGTISFQGAILNPFETITVNGFFYILGIILLCVLAGECIKSLIKEKLKSFWKVRIILKAILLACAWIYPIIIVSATIVLDIFLSFVQFFLQKIKTK